MPAYTCAGANSTSHTRQLVIRHEARVTNFFSLKFDVGHGGVVAHVTKKFTSQFLNLLAIPAPTHPVAPASNDAAMIMMATAIMILSQAAGA